MVFLCSDGLYAFDVNELSYDSLCLKPVKNLSSVIETARILIGIGAQLNSHLHSKILHATLHNVFVSYTIYKVI